MKYFLLAVGVGVWVASGAVMAQAPPRVVPFDGVVADQLGRARTGVVSLTFAFYEEQTGGVPLWVEIQAVELGAEGGYTVLLGAMTPDGLPLQLFATGAARWLGVQAEGQAEGPRVLLASAPYALKAADAETLGGLPVSAFALVGAPAGVVNGSTLAGGTAPSMDEGALGANDPGVISNVFLHAGGAVDGPMCAGNGCLADEVFPNNAEVKLKEFIPSLVFEDTSVGMNPTNDWQIGKLFGGGSSNGNAFFIKDIDADTTPLRIDAGAPENAVRVNAGGNVGIGIATAVSRLHVVSSVASVSET